MGSQRRGTDPFNEKVRARIFGFGLSSSTSSSGSEHEGEYVSPWCSSPCLSYMVKTFLENDSSQVQSYEDSESEFDSKELHRSDPTSLIRNIINSTSHNNADIFRNQLILDVTKATEIFSSFRKINKSIFHRNLMSYLREIGYNAGVCKTKWSSSGNLKAGNYEFLDVISSENGLRYIIDTEFSSEFRIARETNSYEELVGCLQKVFVGSAEEMRKVLKVMSEEAKRSMKVNGLSLGPWRKNRYMQMKWLGPYKRSTNHLPTTGPVLPIVLPVKCRTVGFDVGDNNGFLFPMVSRSR